MTEERLAAVELALSAGGPFGSDPTFAKATVRELCAEVRRLKHVASAFSQEVTESALSGDEKLSIRSRAWRAGNPIEDATNPVCSPEAVDEAVDDYAAQVKRYAMPPVDEATKQAYSVPMDAETAQRIEAIFREARPEAVPHRIPGLMTGKADPGHEVQRLRASMVTMAAEIATLATKVEHLTGEVQASRGAHNSLTGRVEALESALGDTQASWETRFDGRENQVLALDRITALESFEASVTPKVLALEGHLEVLEARMDGQPATEAPAEPDDDKDITDRVASFLEALGGIAMTLPLLEERKALLELLT